MEPAEHVCPETDTPREGFHWGDSRKGSSEEFEVRFPPLFSLLLLALWWPYVALTMSVLTWIDWLYLSLSVRAHQADSTAVDPSQLVG
jgi:hypothetical protein